MARRLTSIELVDLPRYGFMADGEVSFEEAHRQIVRYAHALQKQAARILSASREDFAAYVVEGVHKQKVIRPVRPDPDASLCIACDLAFKAGDQVYSDVSGGCIHASCAGPEAESYVGKDGDPLRPGEPVPQPWEWPAHD